MSVTDCCTMNPKIDEDENSCFLVNVIVGYKYFRTIEPLCDWNNLWCFRKNLISLQNGIKKQSLRLLFI